MKADSAGVRIPADLQRWWTDPSPRLVDVLYRPGAAGGSGLSLEAAFGALGDSQLSPPPGLVPVTFVDDWSLACLATDGSEEYGWRPGHVIRWHLDAIDPHYQGALLDTDINGYIPSLIEELGSAWAKGYADMMKLSQRYQAEFVVPQVTPKAHDLRPFQLACQNVIIGLAAFRRDMRFDGVSVPYWLTCEAPHVATWEGTRALSALLLCDAFQSGGTMEVSFAGHAEHRVPASLRRYGRTRGIQLGAEVDAGKSISPSEARALFWAVTPVPGDLRRRCERLIEAGVCSVERLCYTLLSPVWSAVELDFLAACCSGDRLASIIEGGAKVLDRPDRAAEMELARAAVLLDTFIKCADMKDAAAADTGDAVRLFEDTTNGVTWRVHGEAGVVEVSRLPPGRLPWHPSLSSAGRLVVVPRPHPIMYDFDLAERLRASALAAGAPVAILTSAGVPVAGRPGDPLSGHVPSALPRSTSR